MIYKSSLHKDWFASFVPVVASEAPPERSNASIRHASGIQIRLISNRLKACGDQTTCTFAAGGKEPVGRDMRRARERAASLVARLRFYEGKWRRTT